MLAKLEFACSCCLMLSVSLLILALRDEFVAHGLNDIVTVRCQDVCKDGFGLVGVADAGKCAVWVCIECRFGSVPVGAILL